jgi:hypothetical protein
LLKPEEKIEFSSLMYEIKVLPLNYSSYKGESSDLNREPSVPHTTALPIKLDSPNFIY